MTDLPAHSLLGASSAERWMNCPGSTALLKRLDLPETDEPEYRSLGVAAHLLAASCLEKGWDAWECVGDSALSVFDGDKPVEQHVVDANMADAVQVYLDTVRPIMAEATKYFVEEKFHLPGFHPQFFGTTDFGALCPERVAIVDYKHGEGIVVEPEQNAQGMYYAWGLVVKAGLSADLEMPVDIGIVQPRAYHAVGRVRWWRTTVGEIRRWAEEDLKPAMDRTEIDGDLDVGKHCRFCPAKLICPALSGMFEAAALADAGAVKKFDDAKIAREWRLMAGVKHYLKALEEVAYTRLNAGAEIAGLKLVPKQSKRIFKAGAEAVIRGAFGDKAFTKPELMSPAQLEELGPAAKKIVSEWAYFPDNGLTVALDTDNRVGVKVKQPSEVFAHFTTQEK